jgi:hypothetical protein
MDKGRNRFGLVSRALAREKVRTGLDWKGYDRKGKERKGHERSNILDGVSEGTFAFG